MLTRYRSLTLWYQPTFAESEAQPFGVLIETRTHGYREVFGILKSLPSDTASVTGQVLANLPAILTERIYAAAERSRGDQSILDVLRTELAWNVYAEAPEDLNAEETLRQVGYRLFAERVDCNGDQLANLTQEHIDDLPAHAVGTQYTIDLRA
jgi:hypothetical protein